MFDDYIFKTWTAVPIIKPAINWNLTGVKDKSKLEKFKDFWKCKGNAN
jgi:hypothetical protein